MIIRNLLILLFLSNLGLFAAETGQYAAVLPVDFKEVRLTDGFWTDRYAVNRDVSLLDLWQRANNPDTGHVIQNFQIAAGELDDEFAGTFWQDAWLYKWLETASYSLAS